MPASHTCTLHAHLLPCGWDVCRLSSWACRCCSRLQCCLLPSSQGASSGTPTKVEHQVGCADCAVSCEASELAAVWAADWASSDSVKVPPFVMIACRAARLPAACEARRCYSPMTSAEPSCCCGVSMPSRQILKPHAALWLLSPHGWCRENPTRTGAQTFSKNLTQALTLTPDLPGPHGRGRLPPPARCSSAGSRADTAIPGRRARTCSPAAAGCVVWWASGDRAGPIHAPMHCELVKIRL